MSVTGTKVEFGIAIQKQPFYEEEFVVSQHTWYKIPTIAANVSPQQNIQQYPPEMDGKGLPKGSYKVTVGFAGDINVIPRLKGELAWLLYAALGKVTTTANQPTAGLHKHLFTFSPDVFSLPWLAVRRKLPGQIPTKDYGEVGWDCRIQELNVVIPATGQMTMGFNLVGLRTLQDHNPSWTYANATLPEITSSPLCSLGYVKVGGEKYRVTNASFTVRNQLSSPQDEQTVGSLYAGDITSLTRMASVTMSCIYEDGSLLSQMIANSSVGETVSPEVFRTVTGANSAFEAYFESPIKALSTFPYSIALRGNRVSWQISRPPVPQSGQLMMVEITGIVEEPSSGQYIEIEIVNETAAYVAPVAPTLTGATTQAIFASPYDPLVVDNTLTFTSPLTNLNGGKLRVEMLSNNTATTTLNIASGTPTIGTIHGTYNGTTGKYLLVTLDTDATPAQIQTEIRTVTFDDTAATPATGTRKIKFTVTDAQGGVVSWVREILVV